MKKSILFITAFLLVGLMVAFKPESKGLAIVNQQEGIYIFVQSKPAENAKFLGKINMPEVVWKGKTKEMINTAVRRAKKQFPDCNAVIFTSDNLETAEAFFID